MPIWDPRELEAETCYETKLGLLKLWVKHSVRDWNVAWRVEEFTSRGDLLRTHQRPVKEPKDLYPGLWRRWVFDQGTRRVRLVPLSPDRSLVVQPDVRLWIPAGEHALVFVTVPLWIGVRVGQEGGAVLCEVPTTILSNTWFGDFASGELCYALRSRAKRRLAPAENAYHNAMCPIHVTNAGSAPLELVHLCIQAEHLSVYEAPGRLWTNRVDVVYQGGESRTTIVEGAPDIEGATTLLQPARRVADRSLVRKSFEFLRSLTGSQA